MISDLPSLDHVAALSDDTGIIQHATLSVPNRSTGYCTDDVSRALIVALMRRALAPQDAAASRLAGIYLAFLHDAQLTDGRFHNFMSYERAWLDDVGTHDSCGRAIWSLGYAVRYAGRRDWQEFAAMLFDRALPSIEWLSYSRAQAYALLGLAHAFRTRPRAAYRAAIESLLADSLARIGAVANEDWYWFEDVLTYDNARLPEALIRAGSAVGDRAAVTQGFRTLAFLEEVVFEGELFVPIGNDGWYERGGRRARFAQQPLEAVAMADAELAALDASGPAAHLDRARRAYAWYTGANLLGVPIVRDGGCCDGLESDGVNANMGAESTLAYLSCAYGLALRQKQPAVTR
ncbi:MAG TPA: hypothetical protein VFN49_00720 [Candidatus Aquilonibacter sp.]|nr:hypothetical protein [Candidatus Aquilonibacter sp.]